MSRRARTSSSRPSAVTHTRLEIRSYPFLCIYTSYYIIHISCVLTYSRAVYKPIIEYDLGWSRSRFKTNIGPTQFRASAPACNNTRRAFEVHECRAIVVVYFFRGCRRGGGGGGLFGMYCMTLNAGALFKNISAI